MQEENLEQPINPSSPILQRRYPRYSIDVAVKVLVENQQGISTCCYGRGTEIGEGGMAMYIAHEFKIGETVNVKVTLPYSSHPIECPAIIRNRHSYCYGVEFIGLDQRDRKFLSLMCRGLALVQ